MPTKTNKIIVEKDYKSELSLRLRKIVGVVKLPKDFNEKVELDNYLRKKHS